MNLAEFALDPDQCAFSLSHASSSTKILSRLPDRAKSKDADYP